MTLHQLPAFLLLFILFITTTECGKNTRKPRSCKDIFLKDTNRSDGEYTIYTKGRQPILAYCEFKDAHGYTYLSNFLDKKVNMEELHTTGDHIKMVHLRENGKQFHTKLAELSTFKDRYSLSIQYNLNTGYTTPLNAASLGRYIFVGFLPKSEASHVGSKQGYNAGGEDLTFTNCDGNPNSYIAFFYNQTDITPNDYHKRCCYNNFMKKWIDVSSESSPNAYLPSHFFTFFEMHMGGCGGYIVPRFNSLSKVVGASPGYRFDLTCDDAPCKNGGVCSQNNQIMQCKCQRGFTGKYCEHKLPRSCKEVMGKGLKKGKKGKRWQGGEYVIYNKQDQPFKVFCEYRGKHGYTFISKPDFGVDIDIDELYEPNKHVVVRHLRSNGRQYDSRLEQISSYSFLPLSVQYNAFAEYNRPVNAAHLDPYLYLGFLPKSKSAKKSHQGYRVNGEDITFWNCDANPNSYLVFYFNNRKSDPHGYYKRCCYTSMMRAWIDKANPVEPEDGNYLPTYYFLQTEMHMGGCGGYAVNRYNSLSDIVGASLGLPFAW